jgi:hypothetical protein
MRLLTPPPLQVTNKAQRNETASAVVYWNISFTMHECSPRWQWKSLNGRGSIPHPPARYAHVLVAVNTRYHIFHHLGIPNAVWASLFSYGGFSGKDWLSDLWRYDIASDSWTMLHPTGFRSSVNPFFGIVSLTYTLYSGLLGLEYGASLVFSRSGLLMFGGCSESLHDVIAQDNKCQRDLFLQVSATLIAAYLFTCSDRILYLDCGSL